MAVNSAFHTSNLHSLATERSLYQDLIKEAIQIYGHDVYYVNRTTVAIDTILGEDALSKFNNAQPIEMYVEDAEGFGGDKEIISQFGLENRNEITFVVSKERFQELDSQVTLEDGTDTTGGAILLETGTVETSTLSTLGDSHYILLDTTRTDADRPLEGDLVYHPVLAKMFEINFVEDQDPFFQMSKMFVFKMRCSLFSYGGEDFDTGTAADLVEADSAYTIELTMNTGSGNYIHGENLTTVIDSATVTVGEVVLWQPQSRKLTIKDNTRTLQVNDILTGATSGNVRTIGAITDVLSFGQDHSAQNLEFEQQDSSYLDFSEVNPFGEP